MRLIKLALLSFLIFFGLLTLMSLLIPSRVRISKAVNIGLDRQDSLRPLIADQSRWAEWHPAFEGAAGRSVPADLRIEWQERSDTLLLARLQQGDRQAVRSGWQFHPSGGSDSLALQWFLDFDLKWYPWQKFSSLFYEKTYGVMMERGLENLKNKQ